MPREWKESLIVTIYKIKGDRSVCGNSRGISLLSAAGKTMAKILLDRLIPNISEDIPPETRAGFRLNRFTSDMTFVSTQLLEKCREQHRLFFVGFIDLCKAFDPVDIYIQCVSFFQHQRLDAGAGAQMSFRTDRNLFDLKKLKARTKRKNTRVLELQFADDCTLVAHTPTDL